MESLEPSLQDANDLPGREALAAPEPQRPASHEFLTQADDFRDASDQHLWISVAHTNVVFGDDIRNSVQVTTMDRALQNRTEERPPVKANLQSVYEWEADARESRDGFFSTSPGMERADDGDGPGPLNDGAFFPFAPEGEASAVAEAKDSSSEEEFGQDDMAEMLECLAMATPPPEDRSRGETPETEIVEFLESLLPLDDLEQAAQAGDELMLDHLDHDNKAAGALGSGCQDSGRAPPSTPGTKQRNDTEHPDVCHTSPAMQG